MVGQRLRLGIQPGQSGDRQARRSQSHSVGAAGLPQRAARHRRSEIRRCLAQHDRRGEFTCARASMGRKQYPTMHGANGWYGWRDAPWNVGALEVWYWSQKPQDLERVGRSAWIDFLRGQNPAYPEQALERDLKSIPQRLNAMRRDTHAAGQAPGRQHARLQSGGDRVAGAVDVGRRSCPAARADCSTRACAISIRIASAPACPKTWPRSSRSSPTRARP